MSVLQQKMTGLASSAGRTALANQRLPDTLWAPGGADQRSQEITPINIGRFHGPFAGIQMTVHSFWEMILVCEGEGEMLSARPFPLRPGTICLMPPGVRHIERSPQTMTIIWIGVRGHRVDSMPRDLPLVGQSTAWIRSAITFWEVARKTYGNIGTELDGWTLILYAGLRQALGVQEDAMGDRLEECITYLHTHFQEEINVPALAARCGYSEGYFYRAFKQLTGKTPIQYLTALRVQEALHWLTYSALPIGQIAISVGFFDPHYFTRVIKQYTGLSPLAVRHKALPTTE
jgi:AraC-like DNA-binding protein/mannose-6-phosphate isomerase-like protein (cupin superfamily)